MMTRPFVIFYIVMLAVAAVAAIGFELLQVAAGAILALGAVWFVSACRYCIMKDREERKKPHYWT